MKSLLHDEWLSRILKRDVYRLVLDDALINEIVSENGESDVDLLPKKRSFFVYIKVPVSNVSRIRYLEKQGFHLIDTNVLFSKRILRERQQNNNSTITIRFAEPEDEDQAVDVARNAFRFSRFHLDPAFDKEMANTIKAEWVRNFFKGNRGDSMVVALSDSKIIGFLQLIYSEGRRIVIDLIAVKEGSRGKGIAKTMIAYAEKNCGNYEEIYEEIQVGTQIANVPSLQLYESLGFQIISSEYVFHFHSILDGGLKR